MLFTSSTEVFFPTSKFNTTNEPFGTGTRIAFEVKTRELCEKAVNKVGHALKFVPEKFRTKELCELAIKGINGSSSNLGIYS